MKRKIFEETLKNAYDHSTFIKFVRELLTGIELTAPNVYDNDISGGFEKYVDGYYHIGDYNFDSITKMIVLTVKLKKSGTVERARSMQRGFVRRIIESNNDAAAALVAFYNDDESDKWRLSFVRLDTNFDFEKHKLIKELTPAKRYSYLVGKDEPCSTALHRLFPIFADDSRHISIDELEEAFSVEKVTQEFFDLYALKYRQVREYLENNEDFKQESLTHGFTAEQFSKKLLGQIIFLYFLQKKGWLGVGKNQNWGSGSKDFMRQIFNDCKNQNKNFFDDYLEPLFYTALNEHREHGYYKLLDTRIPFLNGGLFEELKGYDWKKTNFKIENNFFSTADVNGDGVLDIFDRYNFTMNEDEPLEREVAIDPEMLGKVFENLLNSDDRKASGSFYTPREIVHYMCRETLINYLVQKSKISEEIIRNFIMFGEYLKLSEEIINHANELDELLQKVTVVDPAVGSGAFLLGMLNEIVKARETLLTCMNKNYKPYRLKMDTIKNCLFACDIEPSAVDIAKLRLWLSIVIDDEIVADDEPSPLPNLDCNIICGNSLVDEFEGIKLLSRQGNLNQDKINEQIDKLINLQSELFLASDRKIKDKLRDDIKVVYNEIVKESIQDKKLYNKYFTASQEQSKPFILWQLYFPLVFKGNENDGFDIVIGNPPYIDSEMMTKVMPKLRNLYSKKYQSAKGNWDLFVIFIEQGINLLRMNGTISFIVPNKLISAPYAQSIRTIMSKNQIQEIRDYSNVNVFKNAAVYPIVFRLKKYKQDSVNMCIMKNINEVESINIIDANIFYADAYWDKYFNAKILTLLNKIKKFDPLEKIASINSAATVNEAYLIKEFLYDDDGRSNEIKKLINTGGIDKYKSYYGINPITYIKGKYLRPVVRISDLKNMSEKRFNESSVEKIIVGGMNKVIECIYDSGEYLAGKSTVIIYNNEHLKFITAILNSKLMSFYYQNFYNSMSLSGGYFRIGAQQIKTLPIAIPKDKKIIKNIEAKVDKLQLLFSQEQANDDTNKLQDDIDNLVYKIYGLSTDDINCIEDLF